MNDRKPVRGSRQEDIPVGMKRLPLNRSAEFVSQLLVALHTRTLAVARCRISEHLFTSTKGPGLRVCFSPLRISVELKIEPFVVLSISCAVLFRSTWRNVK